MVIDSQQSHIEDLKKGCKSENSCSSELIVEALSQTPRYIEDKYYSGVGRYQFEGGHVYEGQFRQGLLDGFGEIVWDLGNNKIEKFEGIFKDGQKNQVGTYTWSDGTQYSGYWSSDKLDKVGVLRTKDSIKQRQRQSSDVFGLISKIIVNEDQQNTYNLIQQQTIDDAQSNRVSKVTNEPNSTVQQVQENNLTQFNNEQKQFNEMSSLSSQRQSLNSSAIDQYSRLIVQKWMLQANQEVPQRAPQPKHLVCSPLEVLICKSVAGKIYKLYPLPQLLMDSILNAFKPPDTGSSDDDGVSFKQFVDDRKFKHYLQKGIQLLVSLNVDKGNKSKLNRSHQIKGGSGTRMMQHQSSDIFAEDVKQAKNVDIIHKGNTSIDQTYTQIEHTEDDIDDPFQTKASIENAEFVAQDLHDVTQFEGSDTSGQKLLVTITSKYPKTFQTIRDSVKISTKYFVESICGQNLQEKKSSGKSGSIFLISENKQFFLKTINNVECQVLENQLPRYLDHLTTYKNSSLLCKYLGLFHITLQNKFSLVKSKQLGIVVMESVFKMNYQIDRRYDLKGSSKKRTCGKENLYKDNIELKDLDLDMKLELAPHMHKRVTEQLDQDAHFLESLKVMDYSLIIGVHRPFKDRDKNLHNVSSNSKLVSTNSYNQALWIDSQKFNSKNSTSLQGQGQGSPRSVHLVSAYDPGQTSRNSSSRTSQDTEDVSQKSKASISHIWTNVKRSLRPRIMIGKSLLDDGLPKDNIRDLQMLSETSQKGPMEFGMHLARMSTDQNSYAKQQSKERQLQTQPVLINQQHYLQSGFASQAQQYFPIQSELQIQQQPSQQQQQQQQQKQQNQQLFQQQPQQQQNFQQLQDQAAFTSKESTSIQLISDKKYQIRGSYSDQIEGVKNQIGFKSKNDLKGRSKDSQQIKEGQWSHNISPENMVEQIQKLISSGSVFQRPSSSTDLNGNSTGSPPQQGMNNELRCITQEINQLIMHKLSDYNRLLNIGCGGGEAVGESTQYQQNKQDRKGNTYQRSGLDLPSDQKDDVIKITMLLVALVVYKVEAKETQNKEEKRIMDAKNKKQSRVLHRDFTKGQRADIGQTRTYTNNEWFKKEIEGKELGMQMYAIANPQRPQYNQKSIYESPEQVVVCLGIIDYLVEFNWYKYMEYTMKIAMYGMREAKGVSVQPPDVYSQRFLKFMKNNLLEDIS